MDKSSLVTMLCLALICGQTAWSAEASSKDNSVREPASSVAAETKKEAEEPPSRLWNPEWRKTMEDSGFDWSALYVWDGVSNQSGGVKKGGVGFSVLDVFMNFDFEKMVGWTGGSFHVQHHTHGGQNPGEYVGDYSGVNSFSPPYEEDSVISQAYVQQTWGEGSFDLLAGLYDVSAEFFVTDSSLNFLNNTFVIGSELTAPTPAELSVYPVNGPGLRFKWAQEKSFYVMAAHMSAVARDPNFTKGTHPRMGKDEGYYSVVEAGLQNEAGSKAVNKYAFGAWAPSKKAQKADDSTKEVSNWGAYVLVDHHVLENTGVFVRYGKSNSDVNAVDTTMAVGVNQTGIFTEDDQLGIAVSQSSLSKIARSGFELLGLNVVAAETVVEAVYRNEVMPGLVVKPDFQFIKNPLMSKDTKDATVASVRVEVAL